MNNKDIENMKDNLLNLKFMLGKKPSISTKAIEDMLKYTEQLETKANKYNSLVNKIKNKLAKLQEEYELLFERQGGQESNRTKYLRGKIHICQELLEKLEGE